MARKNKIETSPHYNEIVDLLVAGYSGRYVSEHLQNQYNEKITHATLNKYKKNNLNVKAAVRQKIIEKEKEKKSQELEKASKKAIDKEATKKLQVKESIEAAADYRYKDVQKLDNIISESEATTIDLSTCENAEKPDPYKLIELQIKLKKLGIEAMKLKYELIDEEELEVNINENGIIGLAESIEKSRQKYLQELKKE